MSSTDGKVLDSGRFTLETFVQFGEALDVSGWFNYLIRRMNILLDAFLFILTFPASLSKPNPLVSFRSPNHNSANSDDQIVHRLQGLLVPKQPGIFRGNASTMSTAYTLTRFTEVLNSFAANSGATDGSGDRNERSRVALASVFGLCRLCPAGGRYINALGMNSSDLSTQFSAFLICKRIGAIKYVLQVAQLRIF